MEHKTYSPTSLADEGCWFSIDLIDESGSEACLSIIEASAVDEKDPSPWTAGNLAECKRLAYLTAIYEAEKLVQALRNEAIALGFDASHIAVLNARLESGQGLDAVDRAFRQGYIFNHSGQVHAVPALTGGKS